MEIIETSDMRARILSEAARLFVARGYDGISMREIAEACGVSKAGLYYYFKDKEELFVEILYSYLKELSQAIGACNRPDWSVRQKLTAVMEAIFAQPPERRDIIRLAGQEMSQVNPEARRQFGLIYHQEFIGQIETMLAGGIAAGELRSMDVSQAAWVYLGMMYPFFKPTQTPGTGPGNEPARLALQIFFDGVEVRGER
jgi:AcrR family transcriptional regulator